MFGPEVRSVLATALEAERLLAAAANGTPPRARTIPHPPTLLLARPPACRTLLWP